MIKKQVKNEYINLISKEKVEYIKDKIREELRIGIEKEILINAEDAELLNNYIIKLKTELEKNKNK